MSRGELRVVTERELDAFREVHLSPAAILALIERHVRVLLRLPVGVGKTFAAVGLLLWPELYRRFDLVIYAAPAWNILREVIERIEAAGFLGCKVLEPRPTERCGDLDEEWRTYEERSCSTLAKKVLCEERCPHWGTCPWPGQLKDLDGVSLMLMTEQRIELLRNIVPLLMRRTGGLRVLVILDEARSLDADLELALSVDDLARFEETLARTNCRSGDWDAARFQWLGAIRALRRCDEEGFRGGEFGFPDELHRFAYFVQHAGWRLFGKAFRYVGYYLSLLASSRSEERWVNEGEFRFIGRPYLECHLLLLSAHVTAAYAGHRLGQGPVASPYEHVRFLHSGTRVLNLRNSVGADRHFFRNHQQILDTFAVLILRNVCEGRSTLLVSRKKTKRLCARYLEERLRGWGVDVRFVLGGYDELPSTPDPRVVPVIHYGILGVNDFTEYEAAYCLNSFYVNSRELNRAVQEFEPRAFRIELKIVHGKGRMRRAELASSGVSDEDRSWLAGVYLRKLEVDPAIQAVGRVRFLTKPREVVLFQMNDVERELGRCEDLRSLAALRRALGVPTAREIDDYLDGQRARAMMARGMTAEEVAAQLGVSRATVFRRLEAAESLRFPLRDSCRRFETPDALPSVPGGVA